MEMKRVAAVTGGLVVAGAIAGAVAATVAVGAVMMTTEPREIFRDPELLLIGAKMGAAFGSVLGPMAAWLLMRHVPLGVAIGGTMLGTLAGGVGALVVGGGALVLPFAGFAASALAIRFAVPRRAKLAA
jgi:hypothetical protein